MVKKILFITLSNIGDVILTLPVLDFLRANFPEAQITVMAGPRPKEIFENNPYINRLIVYNKQIKLREKIKLFRELKKEKFDLIVDLRNSLFGALLPAGHKTSPLLPIPKKIRHMRDRHLYKIRNPKSEIRNKSQIPNPKSQTKSLFINPQNEEHIEKILKENNIKETDEIIVIAAGAKSHTKRWAKEKFAELARLMIKESFKVILVGDKDDASINKYIAGQTNFAVLDLSAKTTLAQLAGLLKKSALLVTNDSAVLHLASYLNISVLAIFGPTSEEKYAPWSENSAVARKEIFCRPCEKAQCRFGTLDCLRLIKVEDVFRKAKEILFTNHEPRTLPCRQAGTNHDNFKRILIVRTDRIGDVVLSTPAVKALRDNFPDAYIAMMVSPAAKEIVEDNPYLDEVIIYDKDGRHKGWLSSLKFSQRLKKKKFNLALILHPANRVHLITFFAGIRKRVGYGRKLGFLLTQKIKHTKQYGEKHELEYNLDLLKAIGIEAREKNLFMPVKAEAEKWVEDLFLREGINEKDKLLAIHPGASCPSKVWPAQRFAEAADELVKRYELKVIVLAGPKDMNLAAQVIKNMRQPALNLAGKTSVQQLAALLKRSRLFISNDSGPVHIASSVGTPVISIFGRNQKGLSPKRWGPVGMRDKVLHKEVGCSVCLAHNCIKGFACLKAITVDDVIEAADSILV